MDVQTALMRMFPDADPLSDYIVQGNLLVAWNLPEPQPTQAELQAAWIPALKEQKEAELILAADVEEQDAWTAEIEFKYVLVKKMMGQAVSAAQQQKAQAVLAIFDKLETKIGQVRQATTEAEVEAVGWDTS